METIGEFSYPTRGTFKEALDVAQEAIVLYAGTIPAKAAAEKLGFSVKDGSKIGGPIYAKFNDLILFGLFTKERGGYKATETAIKALDPNESAKAAEGKADALRKLPILQKLYRELRGDIPQETALPAKISQILNVPWPEAQKNAPKLLNLLKETFPYMKPSTTAPTVITNPVEQVGRGESIIVNQNVSGMGDLVKPYGEVKTTSGTIVVRSRNMLKLARELLNTLEADFDEYDKQTTQLLKGAKRTDRSAPEDKQEGSK